jgi:hypothetical protein
MRVVRQNILVSYSNCKNPKVKTKYQINIIIKSHRRIIKKQNAPGMDK